LLQSAGKPDLAAEQYRRVLQQDARHEGARFYLANLLLGEGQFNEAARHYAAALTASPDIPPARLLELLARHRAGEPDRQIAAALEERIHNWPDQPELKYALIRLRSLSSDAAVRDSVRALTLANQLAPKQPSLPNIAALALAAAADRQYDQAARLQQQVVDMLGWMPAGDQSQALRDALDAYKNGKLPQQPVWPANDPLFGPPPFNPMEPFRHYPAAVPY
jgi:tetratricopeptide (TPR) repeat protein